MRVHTIFGPPGTGKTQKIIDLAGAEATGGLPTLILSYTRAAALEAAERAKGMAPVGCRNPIRASTIHSLANAALGGGGASVVDPKKLAAYGDEAGIPFAAQTPQGDYEPQEGDEYVNVLQYARNRIIPNLDAYDYFGRPGTRDRFIMFCKSYRDWKDTFGYVDFEDMLERLPSAPMQDYPVVFLDEAQDCSPLQWLAFKAIIIRAKRVYIAGDDDQAIYEWGGADPHSMVDFAKENNSAYKVLEQSYRLPSRVMSYVGATITSEMKKRVPKDFKPRAQGGTIERFGDMTAFPFRKLNSDLSSTMILVRDRYRMKEVQRLLHAEFVPYSMGGRGPYENHYAKAIRAAAKHNDGQQLTSLERQSIVSAGKYKVSDGLPKHISFDDLHIPHWLQEFYQQADLTQPLRVSLSTIHGAKGREADNVIVDLTMPPRVEEGLQLDRDAELRVMYVALTRCKHNLYLCGSNPLL